MSGAASAMAILDVLKASGLGDLVNSAITKAQKMKMSRLKATLELVRVIVDSMDEQGKCDGKTLIKTLLESKHIEVDDEEYTDF